MPISHLNLNGMTPEELDGYIRQHPAGFTVESNGVQYLGRELKIRDGKTYISDTVGNQSV